MPTDLVKRCPTCGMENAPTAARCGCGAFLIGVDLTERAAAAAVVDTGAAEALHGEPQTAVGRERTAAADSVHVSGARAADAGSPRVTDAGSPPRVTDANARTDAPLCAFDDCGQTNPPGSTICVYCNRPLAAGLPATSESAGNSIVIAAQAGIQAQERGPLTARSPTEPAGGSLRGSDAAAAGASREQERPARPASRSTLIRLPAKLAARFAIDEQLKAAGSEADLFVVRDKASGAQAVLKLYRHGIEPDTEVLERVSRAAPDQLVHLFEYGRDEGVPYELLEYCPHGSLRTLLKGRPLPLDAARTLLTELADAIAHLHECGIVHRDLKPENVLIRGLLPLDLVLTDFGIASVTQATMHYTSAARTLRYSAPEAGSNWVGRPTDYWALGMMLVEALSGRHPFEGLSDQVIAHWLVTRPIDVSGVQDPRWQQLCRGFLTRDPKARWGAAEIERWLAGDDTLAVADERPAPAVASAAPYRVGATLCRTPRELAVALAADWSTGVKDLKRGMLRAWLQNDLRDQNLARAAADAEEALAISDDERLLQLLLRLDPGLPPVFKGFDISLGGLAALTRKALEDHNEERQAVVEILDRRITDRFPGNAVQEVHARFEQAKAEFEQALETAFAAGAPRNLAPDGRDWQLRLFLAVLEPPNGLVESLRASARRVGARAAQRCDWYRALGDPETAVAPTLAAMVLLGPPAAQQGMEFEREAARGALAEASMTIDSNPRLLEVHGETRDRLAAAIESSHDEEEVLGLSARLGALSQAIGRSLAALWRDAVFESRPVTEPERLAGLRRRIGEWAAWKAGESWAGFGEQIALVAVSERRSYRVQLTTQIEARRVPYKYGAADIARMPARARATLADVWTCAMPALPQFAADLKVTGSQEVRCPRCGASGRVELQEAWGSTAYPFSTTFACGDKVGVQCQTRIAWANEDLAPGGVPAFVADFVESQAREGDAPERSLGFMAPRIPLQWVGELGPEAARKALVAKLEAATTDAKPGERVSAQRVRIAWTGLAEVRYRYRGKDYAVWIPDRADALPIALEHPLQRAAVAKSQPAAAAAAATALEKSSGRPAERDTASDTVDMPQSAARTRFNWLRTAVYLGGGLLLLACLVIWAVNWTP